MQLLLDPQYKAGPDPSLKYPWYTDISFSCSEDDEIFPEWDADTAELGCLGPCIKVTTNKLRIYCERGYDRHPASGLPVHETQEECSMRQGNTYSLAIELQDEAGSVIDIDLVDRVEFCFWAGQKNVS